MKKLIILLIIILGLSLVAYAGATKVEFFRGPVVDEEDEHSGINGFAIINKTPEGNTTAVVQIQVRDAAANFTYHVQSKSIPRGSFTTNKKGSGHFHFNCSLEEALGLYIAIRTVEGGNNTDELILVYPELL